MQSCPTGYAAGTNIQILLMKIQKSALVEPKDSFLAKLNEVNSIERLGVCCRAEFGELLGPRELNGDARIRR